MIIYILLFITAYTIDILTALLHKKIKPNNFKAFEANERFKKTINRFGLKKGIPIYILNSTTEWIILFFSVGVATKILFKTTISQGIELTFLIMVIFHIGGILTNLISLCKKERQNKQPLQQTQTERFINPQTNTNISERRLENKNG